ncbi:hypothetical protein [Blastococcus sp. URHD0036]|uniref:hypothetical protein n=1 Tax=Blastococcus sp. URHD0036 TaxID=1380356 RepID=UPI0005598CCA|nr:hypothetical protein [Blastococcus sp. URHD0036]
MFDMDGRMVTREHVRDLLAILQLSPAAERRLLDLPYPVEYRVVADAFERAGLSRELLSDRMGGSP